MKETKEKGRKTEVFNSSFHSVSSPALVSCSYTAQFQVSHSFLEWIWLRSLLSGVSPVVACQKRRVVGHHARGPNFQGIFYVFLFVAHKQMHLHFILGEGGL